MQGDDGREGTGNEAVAVIFRVLFLFILCVIFASAGIDAIYSYGRKKQIWAQK